MNSLIASSGYTLLTKTLLAADISTHYSRFSSERLMAYLAHEPARALFYHSALIDCGRKTRQDGSMLTIED